MRCLVCLGTEATPGGKLIADVGEQGGSVIRYFIHSHPR